MKMMKIPPTTYDDLKNVANHPKYILYKMMMPNITSINDLLPSSLILYEGDKVGHWVAIFENEEGVNYFDPQGGYIDKPLKHVDQILTFTYLRQLLGMQHKPIIYNEYKLQLNENMCGYWCAIRLRLSFLNCDQFAELFINNPERDSKIYKYFQMLKYI